MNDMDKILARAAKLLAVQESRGASEAEAAVAAEHLQRLIQDHNLSLSQVEQHGSAGETTSKRVKNEVRMYAATVRTQKWRVTLLDGIARNNFCLAHYEPNSYTGKPPALLVICREVNVQVTKMTYDYLAEVFVRTAQEHGYPAWKTEARKDFVYFMEGAVSRVIERLDERRRERERESAAQPAAGNGTHRELMLSDVYGSESDLNNDALNGFPPGTTAAKRRENAERRARAEAERDRLVAEGVESVEAWYRAHGYSQEMAVEASRSYHKQSRRSGRGSRAQGWSRRDEAEYRKVNSASYQAGRRTGANVGLDAQVGGGNPRRLK